MDFELTPEQRATQEAVWQFAREVAIPIMRDAEKSGAYPRELFRQMGHMGFYASQFPEEYGGTNAGLLMQVLIDEQIARAHGELARGCGLLPAPAIMWFGTEEQRRRFLPGLIRADLVGSFGLSEPGGGSDVAAMKTVARRDGDAYVLNGSKMWITHGTRADVSVIFAKTDPSAGHRGISAFVVEAGTPGLTARPIPIRGLAACFPPAELFFDDCRVPAENLLGEEGQGFRIAMTTLSRGRARIAARSVGVAQACLDASLSYARQREAFGQEIGRYQMVQRTIADVVAELEAARWLLYRAAWTRDEGRPANRISSIAKYFAAEVVGRAASAAMEIHGGFGFSSELPINYYYNFAKLAQNGEGASNIQRILIAEDALGYKLADRHETAAAAAPAAV